MFSKWPTWLIPVGVASVAATVSVALTWSWAVKAKRDEDNEEETPARTDGTQVEGTCCIGRSSLHKKELQKTVEQNAERVCNEDGPSCKTALEETDKQLALSTGAQLASLTGLGSSGTGGLGLAPGAGPWPGVASARRCHSSSMSASEKRDLDMMFKHQERQEARTPNSVGLAKAKQARLRKLRHRETESPSIDDPAPSELERLLAIEQLLATSTPQRPKVPSTSQAARRVKKKPRRKSKLNKTSNPDVHEEATLDQYTTVSTKNVDDNSEAQPEHGLADLAENRCLTLEEADEGYETHTPTPAQTYECSHKESREELEEAEEEEEVEAEEEEEEAEEEDEEEDEDKEEEEAKDGETAQVEQHAMVCDAAVQVDMPALAPMLCASCAQKQQSGSDNLLELSETASAACNVEVLVQGATSTSASGGQSKEHLGVLGPHKKQQKWADLTDSEEEVERAKTRSPVIVDSAGTVPNPPVESKDPVSASMADASSIRNPERHGAPELVGRPECTNPAGPESTPEPAGLETKCWETGMVAKRKPKTRPHRHSMSKM